MFLKFIILALLIVLGIFFIDIILPKISFKFKLYKEKQRIKSNQKKFKNKMKSLEIK